MFIVKGVPPEGPTLDPERGWVFFLLHMPCERLSQVRQHRHAGTGHLHPPYASAAGNNYEFSGTRKR
jgi:hypothetical protein